MDIMPPEPDEKTEGWPWPSRAEGCDAEHPSVYMDRRGGWICRCMVCARCSHHTGNTSQGHYWALCKVTRKMEQFHFCCPGDCELQANA